MVLKFTSNSDVLEALRDASFRDCQDSAFIGGYIIKLFGDVIAWRSHKQSPVCDCSRMLHYLLVKPNTWL